MESITLGKSGVISPRLVYGCMRLAGDNSTAARERGRQAIRAALAGRNLACWCRDGSPCHVDTLLVLANE